jgi:ABC-type Fe3+-hydroxamate transport system substrate-binding protein
MRRIILFAVIAVFWAGGSAWPCLAGYRKVVDARGKEVLVPEKITRVVTISDGLVESVMLILGVQETLVGIGSHCLQLDFDLSWNTESGETFSRTGGGIPVTVLYPRIKSLPRIAMATTAPRSMGSTLTRIRAILKP